MKIVILIVYGLFCYFLGVGLTALLNISKISSLEDELFNEHKNNIQLKNLYDKLANNKAVDGIDSNTISYLVERLNAIIGTCDDEKVLAECNLMLTKLEPLLKKD